jgi:hypothetical protein
MSDMIPFRTSTPFFVIEPDAPPVMGNGKKIGAASGGGLVARLV